MKSLTMAMVVLAMPIAAPAQTPGSEAPVRQTVQAFYAAFNAHGFGHAGPLTA
jgi:hypothetical protein